MTLIETTLVVATIALLVGFAVPAVKALIHSFHTESGARSMISAALNSARTMAVSKQRYVGVRFQKLCVSDDPLDPLKGLMDAPQYMIFIVHDPQNTNLVNGFRAIEGLEPIKLPDTIGVTDPGWIRNDADVDELRELSDATTFSVLFAPSGKLIVHDVRIRNRNGEKRPTNAPGSAKTSYDDVFNSADNVCLYQRGMFIEDDYSPRNPAQGDTLDYGFGQEASRTGFVICEWPQLRTTYERKAAWTEYLGTPAAKAIYVSPYTGQLISSD